MQNDYNRQILHTKNQTASKNEAETEENDILLISHQTTIVPEKHRFEYRPYKSEEYRNVVLFCTTDKIFLIINILFKNINTRYHLIKLCTYSKDTSRTTESPFFIIIQPTTTNFHFHTIFFTIRKIQFSTFEIKN